MFRKRWKFELEFAIIVEGLEINFDLKWTLKVEKMARTCLNKLLEGEKARMKIGWKEENDNKVLELKKTGRWGEIISGLSDGEK